MMEKSRYRCVMPRRQRRRLQDLSIASGDGVLQIETRDWWAEIEMNRLKQNKQVDARHCARWRESARIEICLR